MFPSDLNLEDIPYFFIGLYDYKWSGNMSLHLSITEIGVESANVSVEVVTKVFLLTTNYIVIDSQYMSISSEMFILDSPKTETVFTITNHKNYHTVLLTQFAYQELTVFLILFRLSPILLPSLGSTSIFRDSRWPSLYKYLSN